MRGEGQRQRTEPLSTAADLQKLHQAGMIVGGGLMSEVVAMATTAAAHIIAELERERARAHVCVCVHRYRRNARLMF